MILAPCGNDGSICLRYTAASEVLERALFRKRENLGQ